MNNEQIAQASTAMIIAQQGKQIKKLQKENDELKVELEKEEDFLHDLKVEVYKVFCEIKQGGEELSYKYPLCFEVFKSLFDERVELSRQRERERK